MALPPLPPSNTSRQKVQYSAGPDLHTFELRFGATTGPGVIKTAIVNFLNALAPNLYAIVITDTSYAVAGSNVFLPNDIQLKGSTYGSGVPAGQERTWMYSFTGRGQQTGRRNMIKMFGVKVHADTTYRYIAGENAAVDAAIATLDDAPNDCWLCIDGGPTLWHNYANLKQNDYLVDKLRGA